MPNSKTRYLPALVLVLLSLPIPAHATPIAPAGFTLEAISTQLPEAITSLAIAGPSFGAFSGQTFVSSYTLGEVWRIDGSGAPHLFATGFVLPGYLRFGPGGSWGTDLYVATNSSTQYPTRGRVLRIDATGSVTDLGSPTPESHLYGGGDIAFADGSAYGTALYCGISAGFPGDCVSRFVPPSDATVFVNFPGQPGIGYNGFVGGMEFGVNTAGWTDQLYLALNDQSSSPPPGVPHGGLYRIPASASPAAFPVVTSDTDPRVQQMTRIAFGPGGAFGRTLYCAIRSGRILAIASDGTVNTFVDQSENPPSGSGTDIAFDALGRLCFIEAGRDTLWRLSPATAGVAGSGPHPLEIGATPCPARSATSLSFTLPAGRGGEIACFDVTGRRVRAWNLAPGAGARAIVWDGRDDAGEPVSNGLYFARLTAAGERAVARVLWAR